MKNEVFNNSIGSPYAFDFPRLTPEQDREIIAGLFEQLLIFDRITISTNRLNFGVAFLISRLGINTVERLIDSGYIKFMIWTPVIVTGSGRQREDKTIDESVIYGQPPITVAHFLIQIKTLKKYSQSFITFSDLHKDRKGYLQKALKSYASS